MKILITGATGFLGSHLCRKFVQERHEVTILRREDSNPALIEELNLSQIVGDVTDQQAVIEAAKNQDAVVHAAAQCGSGSEAIFHQVNVEGTKNVLAACERQEVKRLLHVSSAVAIGLPTDRDHPADESLPCDTEHCDSRYQVSKIRAEEVVLDARIFGLDVIVVNPSWILGPKGNRFRGSELFDKDSNSRFIPYFLGGINVVHVDDVVDGIASALKRGRAGERYILSGENVSFRQIAEMNAKASGSKKILVPVPHFISGLAASTFELASKLIGVQPRLTRNEHRYLNRFHYCDSSKARAELGFDPRSFEKIAESYLEFKKQQNLDEILGA